MGFFKDFISDLVENIGVYFAGDNISAVKAFSTETIGFPLNKQIISIGFSSVKNNIADTRYSGENKTGYFFTRALSIELDINIFVPYEIGSDGCFEILNGIMDYFTFEQNRYKVSFINAGKAEHFAKLDAMKLRCTVGIDLNADLQMDNSIEFGGFDIRRRENVV